jgi:hypothetical protein
MKKLTLLLVCGALAGFGIGCGDDGGTTDDDAGMGSDATTGEDADVGEDSGMIADGGATASLTLSFDGLTNVGDDLAYEGWIIVDEAPVSTGVFHVDDDGNLDTDTFEVDAAQAAAASLFVLTIEPEPDSDPAPSATHILAGPLESGSATLTVDHMAAIGTDFSEAAGEYILATPSNGGMPDPDYNQGIWWLVPGESPMAGLELAEAPTGWEYEGWVVDTSGDSPVPYSTGRFTMVSAADADGAGPTGGAEDSPPFPGQDYVTDTVLDLASGDFNAVISLEPALDGDPEAPFVIKPLSDMIEDVMPPMTQDMSNTVADTLPTGTATVSM